MGKLRTLRNAGVTLRISITWRGISEKLLLIRIETVGYILLLRCAANEIHRKPSWITILVSMVHILSKFVRYLPIEQSMIVDTAEGVVIITGCSHPAIVNIVRKSKAILPRDVQRL